MQDVIASAASERPCKAANMAYSRASPYAAEGKADAVDRQEPQHDVDCLQACQDVLRPCTSQSHSCSTIPPSSLTLSSMFAFPCASLRCSGTSSVTAVLLRLPCSGTSSLKQACTSLFHWGLPLRHISRQYQMTGPPCPRDCMEETVPAVLPMA